MSEIVWNKSSVANRWAEIGSVVVNVTKTFPAEGPSAFIVSQKRGLGNEEVARLSFDPADDLVVALLSAHINAHA